MSVLVGGHDVLEAPDLECGRQHQALLVGPQSHRAAGADLVNGKPLRVVDTDQIEPPGLVGGEGEADLIGVEPAAMPREHVMCAAVSCGSAAGGVGPVGASLKWCRSLISGARRFCRKPQAASC